eukprot:7386226-Prymnesium_polylepis.1
MHPWPIGWVHVEGRLVLVVRGQDYRIVLGPEGQGSTHRQRGCPVCPLPEGDRDGGGRHDDAPVLRRRRQGLDRLRIRDPPVARLPEVEALSRLLHRPRLPTVQTARRL